MCIRDRISPDRPTDAPVLRKIIEVIEMQPQEDFMRKYYTEDAWIKRNQIGSQASLETKQEHQQSWTKLFVEVEAALDLDTESNAVQGLAKRWMQLARSTSQGLSLIHISNAPNAITNAPSTSSAPSTTTTQPHQKQTPASSP